MNHDIAGSSPAAGASCGEQGAAMDVGQAMNCDPSSQALRGLSILAVAPCAYHPSGVAVWLDRLSSSLVDAGAIFTAALPSSRLHDLPRYTQLYPRLQTVPLVNKTGSQEGRVRAIARVVAGMRPDVVLGVDIADTYLAVNRVRRATKREMHVALTCHGLVPGVFADAHAYRDVLDAVICVNRLAQAMMADVARLDPARVMYAPCGAGLTSPARPEAREPCDGRQADVLRLAWVGRLEREYKRVEDLVSLVRKLSTAGVPFELVIAGDGTQASNVRAQLESFECSGMVRWLGALPPAEVGAQVFQHADILLVTSQSEASPLVVWEAMAHGVAVVSSRWVGLECEGTLRDGVNCWLFPVGDMAAAVDCIMRARDVPTRSAVVEAARALHRERYSSAASACAWQQAICMMRARRPKPPLSLDPGGAVARGWMDSIVGVAIAEHLRVLLRRRFKHQYPGTEWPWQNHEGMGLDAFMRRASQLDTRTLGPDRVDGRV